MQSINKLLVVIDPDNIKQAALEKAVGIATATGASILALLCHYEKVSDSGDAVENNYLADIKKTAIALKQQWLDEMIQPFKNQGVDITTTIRWHHRLYEAVIFAALHERCDLVLKSTHEHSLLKRILFTPTDWSLLRKCPTPVLLVKSTDDYKKGRILAAIDAVSPDYNHAVLNEIILDSAFYLAKTFQAKMFVANAFPTAPNILPMVTETVSVANVQKSIAQSHKKRTLKLVEKHGIAEDHIYVREGSAEDVVSAIVQEQRINLVVMGTIARTGIPGVLIGNTAEKVLESLNVDVLALKPSDFITPLAK